MKGPQHTVTLSQVFVAFHLSSLEKKEMYNPIKTFSPRVNPLTKKTVFYYRRYQ